MSKVYRATGATGTGMVSVEKCEYIWSDHIAYEIEYRRGRDVGSLAFTNQADADRALAALAREFGWEEVPSE
jgi:hypothetical protein